MAESRKHARSPVRLAARWSQAEEPWEEVECRDVSLGGCFLETSTPPPLGTPVLVHLDLPGLRDQSGREVAAIIPSRVRWTTPEGMGVQFGMMGARETAALVELLGHRTSGVRAKVA